ncbi:uncharacterized protein LOC131671109 [Phymastichus coffea]|uniref:uncharacterized protein LOC131671109 n=1 Tax=Phymastichus coffea TaxID=108790 RepID=UPI00273C9008|nr:uncharacterized protein LOC131671109 [Phymastichus coffea]
MSSSVIGNAPLHETISQAEALKLVKHVSGQDGQLVRYHLRLYNDDRIKKNIGYFQLLLETKLRESSIIEQHSFLVKTISCNNSIAEAEKRVFEHEFNFFHEIVPQLTKHVDVGRWLPKCFLAKRDTLVFENLTTKGYRTRPHMFDEETTRSALRTVARLHASSILAETRLERSLYELYPNAFVDMNFTGHGKNESWYLAAVNAVIKVADNLGLNSSKITAVFDRLQQIATEESEAPLDRRTKWKVASHGDLCENNMMFDNSQPPNCILINFQSVRYVSHAQDILLLLHLCTTRAFRREFEQKLIEFYYSTLRTLSYKYNPAARVLPLDQLKSEIEKERLRAIASAMIYLSSTLLDKRFADDLFENSDKHDKLRYYDRGQQVIELMQRDDIYRQRLEESVKELVDYSQQYV